MTTMQILSKTFSSIFQIREDERGIYDEDSKNYVPYLIKAANFREESADYDPNYNHLELTIKPSLDSCSIMIFMIDRRETGLSEEYPRLFVGYIRSRLNIVQDWRFMGSLAGEITYSYRDIVNQIAAEERQQQTRPA